MNKVVTHETSNNPIVNAYQSVLSVLLHDVLTNANWYGSSFDYFYINKVGLTNLKKYIESKKYRIYHFSGSSKEFMVIADDEIIKINYISDINDCVEPSYKMSYNAISKAAGDLKFAKIIEKYSFIPPNKLKVYNYFYQEGKIVHNELLMDVSPTFNPLAYPYIKDSYSYFEDYFSNHRSVCIFRGKPGTGKTSLIRSLTAKYTPNETPVFYTNSDHAIESDSLFNEFMSSDAKTIVFEDMDLHLTARNDGNTTMYRLLAASDGFIKSPINSKKIIISTNIPNVKELDSALIRPGRCQGIIEFRPLTYDESCAFMESENKDYSWLENKKQYTLAELYNPIF